MLTYNVFVGWSLMFAVFSAHAEPCYALTVFGGVGWIFVSQYRSLRVRPWD